MPLAPTLGMREAQSQVVLPDLWHHQSSLQPHSPHDPQAGHWAPHAGALRLTQQYCHLHTTQGCSAQSRKMLSEPRLLSRPAFSAGAAPSTQQAVLVLAGGTAVLPVFSWQHQTHKLHRWPLSAKCFGCGDVCRGELWFFFCLEANSHLPRVLWVEICHASS